MMGLLGCAFGVASLGSFVGVQAATPMAGKKFCGHVQGEGSEESIDVIIHFLDDKTTKVSGTVMPLGLVLTCDAEGYQFDASSKLVSMVPTTSKKDCLKEQFQNFGEDPSILKLEYADTGDIKLTTPDVTTHLKSSLCKDDEKETVDFGFGDVGRRLVGEFPVLV